MNHKSPPIPSPMPTTLRLSTHLSPLCEKPMPRLRLQVSHRDKISLASPAKINRLFDYHARFPMDPAPRVDGRILYVSWRLPGRVETFAISPL